MIQYPWNKFFHSESLAQKSEEIGHEGKKRVSLIK